MKNIAKILSIVILGLTFSANLFAQNSATASASATILVPIQIDWVADMNFGNIIAGTGGDVVLAPGGGRSADPGITLPPLNAGTVSAASFDVSGEPNATYTIAVAPASITIRNGGNTMTVDDFQTLPTPTGTLDGTGAQTVTVGATLTVGAGQTPGVYTSGAGDLFTVTVNYN